MQIPANRLATNAIILGYQQITSSFTTNGSNTPVTGLSTTVTVPDNGRSIKISAFSLGLSNSGSPSNSDMILVDGSTEIARGRVTSGGANYCAPAMAMAIKTPTPGSSKTYSVWLSNVGGATAQLQATASSPAFILVEAA